MQKSSHIRHVQPPTLGLLPQAFKRCTDSHRRCSNLVVLGNIGVSQIFPTPALPAQPHVARKRTARLGGRENLEKIAEYIAKGENVFLLSNHQVL